ncbi:MAG: hypothetical protein L0H65_18830, partial [Pseudorhodobacter sp.]|nr:hypothetical protein [Pseudorhodobacter sp.]
MKLMKSFDSLASSSVTADRRQVALDRIAASDAAVQEIVARSVPPRQMSAAALAPARGAKRLVDEYLLLPGGTRRYVGAHWIDADILDKMCRDAFGRHEKAGGLVDDFTAP